MGARLFQKIGYIFQSIASIVYNKGEVCLLCENPEEKELICDVCKGQIKILKLKYDVEQQGIKFPCCSLGIYSFNLKKLVLMLKYEKEFMAGKILASYLSSYIKEDLEGNIDLITFVPSSKASYKKRGFNQCEVLCQYVSEECGIPYRSLMRKKSEGRDQIGLDTNKRWENVKDSFMMINKEEVFNRKILLIDDVVTSGATSFYGAKCLKDGGAGEVYILTVAKSRV